MTADTVILACNGYLGGLEPRVATRVMPINNYIIATEPLSDDMARELIRDNVAVSDSKFVVNYYRLSADRRMLFGGRESYSYRFPADIKSFVREAMIEIYPQLANTRIDYGWGGTLGITMNRMPHLAKAGEQCLFRLWLFRPWRGHGNPQRQARRRRCPRPSQMASTSWKRSPQCASPAAPCCAGRSSSSR